jgi:signal transduction histidine kinase
MQEILQIMEDKSQMKNIEIEVCYKGFPDSHRAILNTDKKRLQQIILNLVSNALKFTERNGKILLLVEKIPLEFLRISVVDNGIGIKKKN